MTYLLFGLMLLIGAMSILKKTGVKYGVSSFITTDSYTEVIYELGLSEKGTHFVTELKSIPTVTTVSLVDCHKS